MLIPNQVLNNRYQIMGPLGKQGGMSTVYRAHDRNLQLDCIVKELRVPPDSDLKQAQGAIEQFHHEAVTLANLNHTSLPRVTDYFPADNNYYLVMDFVTGVSLESMIADGIPERMLLGYADQLLGVLAYIHSRNVVHRDIKPANIIIRPDGTAVLVDFGLAKPTNLSTKTFVHGWGTIEYAPLEQMSGGTDVRTDIYSLAATLYHAATGFLPTSSMDRMSGKPLYPPTQMKPGISPQLERALMKALDLNRQMRFQSADEFRQALKTGHLPPRATVPLQGAQNISAAPAQKSNILPVLALVAILLVAAGGVVILQPIIMPSATPTVASRIVTLGPAAAATETLARPTTTLKPAPATTEAPQQPATTEPPPPIATTAVPVVPTTPVPPPPSATARQFSIGNSAGGRDITAYEMGGNGAAIVVVGGIQGEQYKTTNTARDLVNQFFSQPDQVPNGALLVVIPDLNPDGSSSTTRCNAHNVDLNRNWVTANWKANAPPGCNGSTNGTGGSSAFSEPETRALRDILATLIASGRQVVFVVLHTTVQTNKQPQIFPGYTASGIHAQSNMMVERANGILGYQYQTGWDYETTGEAISWCADNGIPAVDILWTTNTSGPSVGQMTQVIDALSR